MTTSDFAQRLADKLIEQLKAGTAPWQQPWEAGKMLSPYNPTTGNRYRGLNILALMASDYADPRWMTYRQALSEVYYPRIDTPSVRNLDFVVTDVDIFTPIWSGPLQPDFASAVKAQPGSTPGAPARGDQRSRESRLRSRGRGPQERVARAWGDAARESLVSYCLVSAKVHDLLRLLTNLLRSTSFYPPRAVAGKA
jgi:hypothetical protein